MVLNRRTPKNQPRSVDDQGRVYATAIDRVAMVAQANAQAGELTIRHKTHGTWIERSLHVSELVAMLDPDGTTYRAI
jgi:hypothetical protein